MIFSSASSFFLRTDSRQRLQLFRTGGVDVHKVGCLRCGGCGFTIFMGGERRLALLQLFVFVASCLSNEFALAGESYAVRRRQGGLTPLQRATGYNFPVLRLTIDHPAPTAVERWL